MNYVRVMEKYLISTYYTYCNLYLWVGPHCHLCMEKENKKSSKKNGLYDTTKVIALAFGKLACYPWEANKSRTKTRAKPVLWIRDILVRIRICGSIPLTYGSCFFRQWKMPTNIHFFKTFFDYYSFKAHLHHKKSKKSQNNRNQGFSCLFCSLIEGSGSPEPYKIMTNPDPGGPKKYGA